MNFYQVDANGLPLAISQGDLTVRVDIRGAADAAFQILKEFSESH